MGELEEPAAHPGQGGSHVSVARAIYGLVTVMALLEAMEIHPPEAGWTGFEILAGTVLTIAFAEAYADTIAGMLVHRKQLSRAEVTIAGKEAAPILFCAMLPAAVLIFAGLGIMGVVRAIDIAQILTYATLIFYGWRTARNMEAGPGAKLVGGITVLAIGILLVTLKNAFH